MAKNKLTPSQKKFTEFMQNFTYTIDGWVTKKSLADIFIGLQNEKTLDPAVVSEIEHLKRHTPFIEDAKTRETLELHINNILEKIT